MSTEVKKATVFKGQRTKPTLDDDLPDLEDKDVQDAATKIQAAFKGHKVRQGKMSSEVKKATVFKGRRTKQTLDDDLPDLEDKDVQDAVTKIQAAFKGFKVRQGKMASEVKKATVFKGQRTKQTIDDDLPDLENKDVQDSATKIQAAFKGHKVRQGKMLAEVKKATVFKGRRTKQTLDDDLPDLEDKDVQDAATKIQAAFKGHKVRSCKKASNDDLPDLKDAKVAEATMKIQTVYRGFHARKEVKQIKEENAAASKIQALFKVAKARQEVKTRTTVTADSVAKAFGMTTSTVTSSETVRRKAPATPAPSVDLDNLPPPPPEQERKSSLVLEGTSNANFKKRGPTPKNTTKLDLGAVQKQQQQRKSQLPE
jgi:uncharacterized protein YifN (PemK superfamily)